CSRPPAIQAGGSTVGPIGIVGRTVEPNLSKRARPERSGSPGRERAVDAPQRLLAAEQRDALEYPRRDGRARERDAQRLIDLARLDAHARYGGLQRLLDVLLVEAR